MTELNKYEEQFNRVNRWYDRFKQLNDGKLHNQISNEYVDDVYAFFINCFHLKDWIKNDDNITTSKDVEIFITENPSLEMCRELCHSLKHLILRDPSDYRYTKEKQFSSRHFAYDVSTQTIKIKFDIITQDGIKDAFEIATECMEKWEEFISNEIKL